MSGDWKEKELPEDGTAQSEPGDRSGSGAKSLWEHLAQDAQRKAAAGAHSVSPPTPQRSRFTVLVVDDNESARYALARTLRSVGYQTLEARAGAEAIALAPQSAAVVLDVNLPDLDGVEVCRLLRKDRATARLPIIHVSASSLDQQSAAASADAGADAYLIAPVPPDELVHAVDLFISRSAP